MMKKLLIVLFALGTLSFVPTADARCRARCEKRCRKPAPCDTAPKCETEVQKQIVWEPCEKTVRIKGECPHEICTTVTKCQRKSKKCVGPCEGGCPTGVTASDRGEEPSKFRGKEASYSSDEDSDESYD